MAQDITGIDRIFAFAPVMPVLIVEDAKKAVPMARAIVKGGLAAIEITLRTDAALDAVKLVANEVEGAAVGAGTALSAAQFNSAVASGAEFVVSPGATPRLLDAAEQSEVPLLPGASSASESMLLLERGYTRQKFFPAQAAGGAAFLQALHSPLPEIRFCPTGGITLENAPGYLSLPNVPCVGGSWIAPTALIEEENWERIELNARAATQLANRLANLGPVQ